MRVLFSLPGARLGLGVVAIGLALFTSFIRFRALGYTEMWGDQSQEIGGALAWLNGGPPPLTAMKSSFGVFQAPLIRYLYAIPLAVNRSVMGVLWWTALANVAGVLVFGGVVARLLGWRIAAWLTVLYAVNPWSVYYSHLIWMPTFVPFFACLLLASVLLYVAETPRPLYVIVAAIALAGVIQVHLAGVVLIGILALVIGILSPRLHLWALIVGALLFGLSFVPYLVFQWQSHWVDLATLQSGLGREANFNLAAVLLAFDLLQSQGVYTTAGLAAESWRAADPLGRTVDSLITVAFVVAHGWALWRVVRVLITRQPRATWDRRTRVSVVLLLWLTAPILIFLRHSHYLQNYYFLYWVPAQLFLIVMMTDEVGEALAQRWPRLGGWRWIVYAPIGVVVLQQLWMTTVGQNLMAAGAAGRQRVVDVERALQSAQRLMAERPDCQLVVVSEGRGYASASLGFWREYFPPGRVRFMQTGIGYLVPPTCAVYFMSVNDTTTEQWLGAHAEPLESETITTPELTWRFYSLTAAQRAVMVKAWEAQPDPLADWADGVHLWKVEAEQPARSGGALSLVTTWSLTKSARADIQFGNYLLKAESTLVAQVDGNGIESASWQSGDRFQMRFGLPVPADVPSGTYRLALALYTLPEVQRLPLASNNGDLFVVGNIQVTAP
ncbi:MAG: ArnT family glycosyltransferase [Anaerolineales bacterium]